jgi:hypothetical protein
MRDLLLLPLALGARAAKGTEVCGAPKGSEYAGDRRVLRHCPAWHVDQARDGAPRKTPPCRCRLRHSRVDRLVTQRRNRRLGGLVGGAA